MSNFENYKILAVVPARGGSKGIPRKNLQKVGGLSLIARAAEIIKSINIIDKAIISTDDLEIAEEAFKNGLEVPFIRPQHLSNDTALSVDVWQHAWLFAEDFYNTVFDISILLEPTSPLRRVEDIYLTLDKITIEGYSAAATISKTPGHYTPHKTLKLEEDGTIGFYLNDGNKFSIRQKIPQYYHRNGVCYAATRNHLLEKKMIIDKNAAAVILDRPLINIDEPIDLELAEWYLNKNY